jgi:hypothetical protein
VRGVRSRMTMGLRNVKDVSTQRNSERDPPRGAAALIVPGPSHYRDFTITLRHTTLGRTSLDE